MNKNLKKIMVLVFAICLVLTMGLFAACDNTPKEVEYTITVTCEDAEVLSKIKVKVTNSDGTVNKQGALTNGKITFTLTEGDYTVTLADVPDNYDYTAGQLSATTTECTLTLKKVYTVNVAYPEIKDVYGKIFREAGPAANVTVTLYEGELARDLPSDLEKATIADTQITDENGQAKFDLKGDVYTVILDNYLPGLEVNQLSEDKIVNTVGKNAPSIDLTFKIRYAPGTSDKSPIGLHLGENTIPVTVEILRELETSAVIYEFTPEKSGNYTIAATGNAKVLIAISGALFDLRGDNSAVLELEAGESYLFYCGTNSSNVKTYTVTITEGGNAIPNLGTLEGTHSVTIEAGESNDPDVTGDVVSVWYKYTATQSETYTLTDSTQKLWCVICPGSPNKNAQGTVEFLGDETPGGSVEFSVQSGMTYYFWICTFDEQPGTVTFTIAQKESAPSSDGTKEHPFVLDELVNDYHYPITDIIYLSYTAQAGGNYVVSTADKNARITVYSTSQNSQTKLFTLEQNALSHQFATTAGETYLISVEAVDYGDSGTYITFSIIEQTETFGVDVAVKLVNGSAANAGITVRLINENNKEVSAVTNASGIAHFDVANGTYTIQIPKIVSDNGLKDNGPQGGTEFEFPSNMYTVTVNGQNTTATVQYQYFRDLEITVKDGNGNPVAGATVILTNDSGYSYEAETDEHGVAKFAKSDKQIHEDEHFTIQVNATEVGEVTIDGDTTKTVTYTAAK